MEAIAHVGLNGNVEHLPLAGPTFATLRPGVARLLRYIPPCAAGPLLAHLADIAAFVTTIKAAVRKESSIPCP